MEDTFKKLKLYIERKIIKAVKVGTDPRKAIEVVECELEEESGGN